MKHNLLIGAALMLTLSGLTINARHLDCDDLSTISPEEARSGLLLPIGEDSIDDNIRLLLRRSGCNFIKGATATSKGLNKFMGAVIKSVKGEAIDVFAKLRVKEKTDELNTDALESFNTLMHVDVLEEPKEWTDMLDGLIKIRRDANDIYNKLDVKEIQKEWSADIRKGYRKFIQNAKVAIHETFDEKLDRKARK